MKRRSPLPIQLTAASVLVLAASGVLAQESTEETEAAEESKPYTPLGLLNRPQAPGQPGDQLGRLELGAAYVSDDNYMFGQYNGLSDDDASLIGNLQWQQFSGESYWKTSFTDMGLPTREGEIAWGRPDRLRVNVGFDSQRQVRNDTGRTPFSGSSNLGLPANWESGTFTSDFGTLDESLRGFDRELDRDQLFAGIELRLSERWRLSSNLSYEEKEGDGDVGAAIYTNLVGGDSVLLRQTIDYATTEFDLGLAFDGDKLKLNGELAYSDFDNDDDVLTWQNPYSSYGPRVRYPEGTGGLGLAPDNEQVSGRLTGHYVFSSTMRLQLDTSYAIASQDQDYLDYTVNDALVVTEPLPQDDYDGEVAIGTVNTKLMFRPLPKMNAEVFYKLRDRDYDADRDGYRYVRGDATDQPGQALTVYNTNHDLTEQSAGFEVDYRLPWRSKLTVGYEYEEVDRRNSAVEETEEDIYTLAYRIQPWSNFTTRLQLQYADRAADTYEWAQDYYALLDVELINATPDNQRYTNHPQLMQYYMANRERWEGKADFSYLPSDRWNLNLNTLWRYDDYDQSRLGLTESEWIRGQFSASYVASETLSTTVYVGYDRYDGNQSSRAFRGGQEKNAFEVYPPLPQASDPQQNWDLDAEDHTVTLGASLLWQPAADLELALDYSYVDTTAEQELQTRPGSSSTASDLPDVDTTLHHVEASGTWHLQDNLSLKLDYQYYSYESDDWAWDKVQANTIGKVLTFGQDNPDEDLHYVGASVIYRWQ
jgi:MtrB/PioB family decaheme-associated outer membrane protein